MDPFSPARRHFVLGASGLLLCACKSKVASPVPAIHFSRIPRAAQDAGGQNDIIEGDVSGAPPDSRLVLYAKNGSWWVQPTELSPFTKLRPNSRWTNATRLGSEYAALLVQPGYTPEARINELPSPGGPIKAVAVTRGASASPSPSIAFDGYDWRLRTAPSARGGNTNPYSPANIWKDASGALHLRMVKAGADWSCAEAALTRSLGYGTYQFQVRDISQLPPSAVFSIFTYDYATFDSNASEVDIEISRWGDPANRNSQYIIQPFNVPTNVARFQSPPGVLIHSLQWQPGRMLFRTVRPSGLLVAQHEFKSSIPRPGLESIRMTLYPFRQGTVQIENGIEVVVEKFQYLP